MGRLVLERSIVVDPAKVAKVQDWRRPENATDIRSFLGLAGYYRRFNKEFPRTAVLLTNLTRKNQAFIWDVRCEQAFVSMKEKLTNAPFLIISESNVEMDVAQDWRQF